MKLKVFTPILTSMSFFNRSVITKTALTRSTFKDPDHGKENPLKVRFFFCLFYFTRHQGKLNYQNIDHFHKAFFFCFFTTSISAMFNIKCRYFMIATWDVNQFFVDINFRMVHSMIQYLSFLSFWIFEATHFKLHATDASSSSFFNEYGISVIRNYHSEFRLLISERGWSEVHFF